MYSVDLSDVEKALRGLKAEAEVSLKHFRIAAEATSRLVQGGARKLAPVDQGALRQSITGEVLGGAVESLQARVFSDLSEEEVYPSVMEFGRKAGSMPPPSALERWVHLKLGVPEHLAAGVAFVVARAIGRHGIPGKFFFKRAFESTEAQVRNYWKAALDRIADEMARRMD